MAEVIVETFEEFRLAVARGERSLPRKPSNPAGANLLSLTPGWRASKPAPAPYETTLPLPEHAECLRCGSVLLAQSRAQLAVRVDRHREALCRKRGLVTKLEASLLGSPGAVERLTPAPE